MSLRFDVADLLRQTSARRALSVREELELGGSAARVVGPVTIDVNLERIPDGLVVAGRITGRWHAQCSEGLEDLDCEFGLDVRELFESEPVEGETYPIEGTDIDLEQLARDTVLVELPLAPVCSAGHREVRAALDEEPPDPRWAPLADLQLSSHSGASDGSPQA